MSEPTVAELIAEVALLKQRLAEVAAGQSPFIHEVSGVAPPNQPDKKTSQAPTRVVPVAPTPLALALARALDPRRRLSKSTPEELLAMIGSIKSVIVSGVNSAGYGDKRTEFRSLSELRQILNGLEEELEELLGTGGRIRQIRMTTSADKGL